MRSNSVIFLSVLLMGQAQALTLPNQSPVKTYECSNCNKLSHENLSLSWALHHNKLLGNEPLHQQTSRKSFVKVTLKQLNKGVAIYTEAPGAIIRISPVNPKKTLKPEFRIRAAKGTDLSLIDASSVFSKDEALKNTAFAENTLAISELKPELGFGKFIISSTETSSAQTDEESQFAIHVDDHNSTIHLSIETAKAHYQYGDELTATFILHDKKENYAIDSINVFLEDPKGSKTTLNARPINAKTYVVKFPLLSEKNAQGKNWYIEALVTGHTANYLSLNRQGHTSFSYTIPSAAVREITRTSPDSFDFSTKIEAALESRYALQAVLFGSDENAKLHAIQTVQTAAWLKAGMNDLNFSFDPKLKSLYQAPYYIGYLRLTDFGQQKPVFIQDTPIELSKLG